MKTNDVAAIIMGLFILASIVWGIWYGFFWWGTCANTPILEQPGLCFIGNRR